MPRLVGGRQPPRAAAARFTFARTRLSSHLDWSVTGAGEGSSSHAFFITYSARGGTCG